MCGISNSSEFFYLLLDVVNRNIGSVRKKVLLVSDNVVVTVKNKLFTEKLGLVFDKETVPFNK